MTDENKDSLPASNDRDLPRWPWRGKDVTDLSADELEELERRSDPLIDLVGYVERHWPDSAAYDDPRFLAWLARERRSWEKPGALGSDAIRALRDRILESWHAEGLGVRLASESLRREPLGWGEGGMAVSDALELLEADHRAADPELAIAAGEGRELWNAQVEMCVPLPDDIAPGKHVVLRVSGDSMEPLFHDGDVVLVRVGTDPEPNTVVVARGAEGDYVMKKVARVSGGSLELHSLNPAYAPLTVSRSQNGVLGRVLMRWCEHTS